eukprot:4665440-Prymnesium_polylepis.1
MEAGRSECMADEGAGEAEEGPAGARGLGRPSLSALHVPDGARVCDEVRDLERLKGAEAAVVGVVRIGQLRP